MRRLRSLLAPSLALSSLTVVACVPDHAPPGSDDADGFSLAQAAQTRHLAAALDGGEALTLGGLIDKGGALTFKGTPDPTELLTQMAALDEGIAHDGAPLRVLTWNVALLDAKLLGFIDYKATPLLEERRRALPALAFSKDADVVMLQEVWLPEDVATFTENAAEHGYRAFTQDRTGHNDGLITFVKESVLDGGSVPTFGFRAYASQDVTEYFPGPGIQRGYTWVHFVHKEIGPVLVYNTHMSAFPGNWLSRVKQGRELGHASQIEASDGEIVLLGGDMNAGPYYKAATWNVPDGSVDDTWFHNTISWAVTMLYADAVDLPVVGRSVEDAAIDVTLGNTVINDATTSTQIPGAAPGWCDATPHTVFTASDCNVLYFRQYAGTEYPARIDHLFAHDPEQRIVVDHSEIAFTEAQRFDGTGEGHGGDNEGQPVVSEPSDHYGVLVDLFVRAR